MIELARARAVLREAIDARVFPGAVVEVGQRAGPVVSLVEGRLTYDPDAARVTEDTIYDLASLTKVLSTTALALELVREGRLQLDDTVGRYIPEWRGEDRQAVTIRHLLDHSSGLPAHRRYFEHMEGREAIAQAIARPHFRPYISTDVIGAEIGGAIKNILAIACGIVDGAELGLNARAALISRGFAEMTRFGLARGADDGRTCPSEPRIGPAGATIR